MNQFQFICIICYLSFILTIVSPQNGLWRKILVGIAPLLTALAAYITVQIIIHLLQS